MRDRLHVAVGDTVGDTLERTEDAQCCWGHSTWNLRASRLHARAAANKLADAQRGSGGKIFSRIETKVITK